ncbi:MAG: hypothetical protein JSW26_24520, partial [Desulfobacterales bacterium]
KVPRTVPLHKVRVYLNGKNVTGQFQSFHDDWKHKNRERSLNGLLSGLKTGSNNLVVRANGHGKGRPSAKLELTNYPIWGPIISGDHETPFICQTEDFVIGHGTIQGYAAGDLGPPIDEQCSILTRVDYIYKCDPAESCDDLTTPATEVFKPWPGDYPDDLAWTTTLTGKSVPFIARVETGTINRSVYQTIILDDPLDDLEPSPWTRSDGWHGGLVYRFGGGCRQGWYVQGISTGDLFQSNQIELLSRGWALATSTLSVMGNNCNDLLSSETTIMVKERFIESYGMPDYTLGYGSSGGSYQSHQTADAYPGVFDGIIVYSSFPDVTSATIFSLHDGRLLENFFYRNPDWGTDLEKWTVAGFGANPDNVGTYVAGMSDGANRIDPIYDRSDLDPADWWNPALHGEFRSGFPLDLAYHPVVNPAGARSTVYDHTVNVYGTVEWEPPGGTHTLYVAGRPLDNVGVQYGLRALNNEDITVDRFLELNEKIGGLDRDANYSPFRTVADPEASVAASETGRILYGGEGLAITPIIDYRQYRDSRAFDIHQKIHQFSTRERLLKANGHFKNQVMLVSDASAWQGFDWDDPWDNTGSPDLAHPFIMMDKWLRRLPEFSKRTPQKVVSAKPKALKEACYEEAPTDYIKHVETQTYYPGSTCSDLYPVSDTPRHIAGAPLSNEIVKCQLKPIDVNDYTVDFTDEQKNRLEEIFPTGVCDWSKPGVYQRPLKSTWLSFGPSEVNFYESEY